MIIAGSSFVPGPSKVSFSLQVLYFESVMAKVFIVTDVRIYVLWPQSGCFDNWIGVSALIGSVLLPTTLIIQRRCNYRDSFMVDSSVSCRCRLWVVVPLVQFLVMQFNHSNDDSAYLCNVEPIQKNPWRSLVHLCSANHHIVRHRRDIQ